MSAVDPGHQNHLGIGMGTGKDGAETIDDTTAAAATISPSVSGRIGHFSQDHDACSSTRFNSP
jgi:hypothetical protein